MEIGIHGFELRHVNEYADLGVTWTKWGAEFLRHENERPALAAAREAGLEVVLDLRTGAQAIDLLWHSYGDPTAVAEIVAKSAVGFVERHADLCHHWEFWGEWDCPSVAGGVFRHVPYALLLKHVYAAIKTVQPEARVWTGGNGANLNPRWLEQLLETDCLQSFDVCNWHPYYISLRDYEGTGLRTDRILNYARQRLTEAGGRQPFAATEWGYPVTEQPRSLVSNVVQGCRSLDYTEAVEWYERDLAAFEQHGFEVVIVHALRDEPHKGTPNFWGQYCGLQDAEGRRKPTWDVVQRWAKKGRIA